MIPISFAGFSDPVSSWSHLLAGATSLVGMGALLGKGRGNAARIASLCVFSFALIFLFSMSGVFHLLERGSLGRNVLQRLDHAGIWVLIAGTFTPIHVILFRGYHRWLVLLGVWTAAITGLTLEIVFFNDVPETLLVSLFLGLGWVGAGSGFLFRRSYGDPSIWLLAAGGALYSLGAIIDFVKWPVLISDILGPHELFHFCVIAAAACHWSFVYRWCDHPVHNRIIFNVSVFPDHVIAKAVSENMEIEADNLELARERIRDAVTRRFHSTITPEIRLRYFKEEFLASS